MGSASTVHSVKVSCGWVRLVSQVKVNDRASGCDGVRDPVNSKTNDTDGVLFRRCEMRAVTLFLLSPVILVLLVLLVILNSIAVLFDDGFWEPV